MNNYEVQKDLPEIWGGLECTINRVGDSYMDQLEISRFYNCPWYLDSIIGLGINTLRFPILWERHQTQHGGNIDWSWSLTQLNKLKINNVEPIAGLLHHGSGPLFTNLLDDNFPELFAEYAYSVAEQFPWIKYYTPINEPLTTARFSGLYGHWYPHRADDISFLKILLIELKATVLSMRAIRQINPHAKLVQTEDLGRTYSTPLLSYQAVFENHRRFLTYDILSGKFDDAHPLWNYFIQLGIDESNMRWFLQNTCVPDIIGVNYYLTSERYLDHNIDNYHFSTHGSNGIHNYADVEAVRVEMTEHYGPEFLLTDLWQRYHIPIAVTEAHLHCSREEQMRWLKYIYDIAIKIKNNGVNIIAVTVWAMIGSFGWNRLLTSRDGEYETGAFDISAGYMRPTAIAFMIKGLIKKGWYQHPLLLNKGWWQKASRYFNSSAKPGENEETGTPPLLIIGNNLMADIYSSYCNARNIITAVISPDKLSPENLKSLKDQIEIFNPWAIVYAVTPVEISDAKGSFAQVDKEIFIMRNLSIICRQKNIKVMCFSSPDVFDGSKENYYVESDEPDYDSLSVNKKCYVEFIHALQNSNALIIRTGDLFGTGDNRNYLDEALQNLFNGGQIYILGNQKISPAYLPHVVDASIDLLIDNASGICHLVNKSTTEITSLDFIKRAGEEAGISETSIIPGLANSHKHLPRIASERYAVMPALEHAMKEFFNTQQVFIH